MSLKLLKAELEELLLVRAEKRGDLETAQEAAAVAEARVETMQRAVEIMEKAAAEPAEEPAAPPRAKPGEVEKAVRARLAELPHAHAATPEFLAEGSGLRLDSIKAVLRRLLERGDVTQHGDGYRLRPAETREAAE